ncbi:MULTISPECIES: alanine/glycine:cation symporter family protein [unclassified Corynebacterium]|uniref:alanine/glycine:cation symporter family protein n=1 Tax=unclassified Corynebacterium TaxID=2624378 RepID=UPI0029CA3FEC|nr:MULTISPECIES: alanine/glycine:cation symporter family protein [unclassified Corynebacterium]WPF65368.1 alanine/glycine:cation symporter family protein [Corynebacterium sp. 22KM0430]WPF67863.1 alanine/glycine:cation symporter family protein [Corynebacterium sp. 21KM1197]
MDFLVDAVEAINNIFWAVWVVPVLILSGLAYCFRTALVQIRFLPDMFRSVVEKPSEISEGTKGISAFKAFTMSAASRVGTGNVAGVALAVAVGGPGAVFWMWCLAIVGGATSFIESTLAQVYKVRDKDSYRGGPAYYMTRALGWKPLAVVFAVVICVTYGFVFNAVQSNSISAAISTSMGSDDTGTNAVIGLVLAAVTLVIVFGGVQRIASFTQTVVPVMAVLYIVLAFIVIGLNIDKVPGMIVDIVAHAFGFREFAGATLATVFIQGVRRGLFSNEAGMGSVPNAAATASVSHPAKQGLIQTLGVYFDTLVVCSMTAFIILLAGQDLSQETGGMELTQNALAASVGEWGIHFLTFIIIFLAYSSIIGNYYYGESNIEYLAGKRRSKQWLRAFRVLVAVCVFGGAIGSVPLVWALADVFSGLMASINLIALVPLSGVAVAVLRHYSVQRRAGLNPVFHREDMPRSTLGWKHMEAWDGADPITVRDERYANLDYQWRK